MRAGFIGLILIAFQVCCRAQVFTPDNNFSLPLRHLKLNSSFGYRAHPLTGHWRFHQGIDLAARRDTVFCIMNGIVTRSGYDPGLGIYMRVMHGGKLFSAYGHLSSLWVATGDTVLAGMPLGITGSTGRVTGEHLHLAIGYGGYFINPLRWIAALLQIRSLLSQSASRAPPEVK